MKILFICRANVGRSQMAEAIFNKLAEGRHTATSAGTLCVNSEGKSREGIMLKDIPGAEKVIDVLKEIDIDATHNVCNQLTPEMLDAADKAVVMAENETIPDWLSKSEKFIYWDVADPKKQSVEFTRNTRDQIRGLVEGLIETLD